jgi:putative ABC transport system permease protein
MLLAELAWRNLWRRPQRTYLSLVSIALVCGLLVFVLSFQVGVYAAMTETTLRIFDGYAEFQPAGYAADPTLDKTIADPGGLAETARGLPGVTAAAPRVNSFAILSHGARSYAAAVVGVEPASEDKISTLDDRISDGRYLTPADQASARSSIQTMTPICAGFKPSASSVPNSRVRSSTLISSVFRMMKATTSTSVA